MIPKFDKNGNLPPGIHQVTWDEFEERYGHNIYRKRLIKGMKSAFKNLKQAGCSIIYMDGSFVTEKRRPNDYDGCWETKGVNINSLDPTLKDFRHGRMAQKIKFSGELFPATMNSSLDQTMLEFFQNDRENNSKGIVQINLGDLDD